MSCSGKYNKLIEYLKTHYTYQLKLNSFSLGDRESTEDAIKCQIYGDVMEFVENLEKEEEIKDKHKNNLIPIDFSGTLAADTISFSSNSDLIYSSTGTTTSYGGLNFDTITLGGSDTLNFGTPLPGGMGEDHISFSGVAGTQYDLSLIHI